MMQHQRILELWAADLRGFYPHLVEQAAQETAQILPRNAGLVEQTVLARWVGLTVWLQHITTHELTIPLDDVPRFWRGLRAVAETRAAPTSPLGQAILAVVADIRRLPQVQAADQMLVSLAVADLLDGVAMHYRWRHDGHAPTPAEALLAASRATGTLGLYACLGAVQGWDLCTLMPSHPIRRLILQVGDVRALAAQADIDQTRRSEREEQIRSSLDTLEPRWKPLRDWTELIVASLPSNPAPTSGTGLEVEVDLP